LPAFEAAVKEAHTGAIMGSYNLTNGLYMTENRRLIKDVLKGEWGFDGVYMSDWFATHDAIAAANAGTDLEMPEAQHFNRPMLSPALQQGKVSQATIDDKVRRLLRNQARFGWLDGRMSDDTTPNYNVEGARAALQAAREGHGAAQERRRAFSPSTEPKSKPSR
jgi:beta-glucosidase